MGKHDRKQSAAPAGASASSGANARPISLFEGDDEVPTFSFSSSKPQTSKSSSNASSASSSSAPSSAPALTINRKFASSYDERKRKQELGKARDLGLSVRGMEEEDDESTEDEGENLTAQLDARIMETIKAIRKKDPRVYDPATKFFEAPGKKDGASGKEGDDEEDGEEEEEEAASSSKPSSKVQKMKKKTAKDVLREQLMAAAEEGRSDAFDEDDDLTLNKRQMDTSDRSVNVRMYDAEQAELRKAFLETAEAEVGDAKKKKKKSKKDKKDTKESKKGKKEEVESSDDDEEDAEDEAGLLRVSNRRAAAADDDDDDNDDDSVNSADREELLRFMRRKDGALAAHADEMEDPDKFLEAFATSRAWKQLEKEGHESDEYDQFEKPGAAGSSSSAGADGDARTKERLARLGAAVVDDDEDEQYLDRVDEFEAKYNFRFEEPGGGQIVTHARNAGAEESLRRKDNKRKDERERRATRKEEERAEAEAETRRLMNLKRTELKSRMGRIRDVAGAGIDMARLADIVGEDLDADFDPEEHDRRMAKLFGDDYYAQGEEEERVAASLPTDAAMKDRQRAAAAAAGGKGRKGEKNAVVVPAPAPAAAGAADDDEDDDDDEDGTSKLPAWVFGDGARPAWAGPGAEQLAAGEDDLGIDKVVGGGGKSYFGGGDDEDGGEGEDGEDNDDGYDPAVHGRRRVREGKRKRESKKRMGALARVKSILAEEARNSREKGSNGAEEDADADEVLALGFEDVIAGGLKTRFKYIEVPAQDFGLSTEDLMLADEKDLNSYVGLRRIAPYREEEWKVPKKVRQSKVQAIRQRVQEEIEKLGLAKPNVVGGGRSSSSASSAAAEEEEEQEEKVVASAAGDDGEGEAEAEALSDDGAEEPSKKKSRRKHKNKDKESKKEKQEEAADEDGVAVSSSSSSSSSSAAAGSGSGKEEAGKKKDKRDKKEKKDKKDKKEKDKDAFKTLPGGVKIKESRLSSYAI